MSGDESSPEARLRELGIELPAVRAPVGTFVQCVRSGSTLYLSGQPPFRADGSIVLGRLGADLDVDAGYEAARLAGLNALAAVREAIGSLDRVVRFLRVYGVVNATPEFNRHTQVINGASDLFVAAFGERGRHARLAVGVSSLPFNICLEVEATIEVEAGD